MRHYAITGKGCDVGCTLTEERAEELRAAGWHVVPWLLPC